MSTLTRKIQIIPVGDKEESKRVYKYLRDGIFNQNKAMNQYMSALYTSAIQEASTEDRKLLNQLYTRISTSKKGSAYPSDIVFPKGLPTTASLGQKVRQDFQKSVKDGLLYGKVSLPTYHMDNPLLIHVDYVALSGSRKNGGRAITTGLYHNYESHTEFLDHLYKNDLEVFIKFANNITFKIIFGSVKKSLTLRNEFKNIFEEYYTVQGSSIQIDDKKIILNMSMNVPNKEVELDENVVVGVDLGQAIPAVCALNTNSYAKKYIGSSDDFLRVRTQMQSQRRRLQSNLKMSSGGHGRNKKMKALDKFSKREHNFVTTYNHFVSKQVVDFALKNKAKYINLENLEGYDANKFILRNWSYYQLQQYITYKASMCGIEVRKINPYHTSQDCSICGYWEEGQRKSQKEFVCNNPKCKCYGKIMNADLNAARNISKSIDFCEEKKSVEELKNSHEKAKKVALKIKKEIA